MSNEEQSRGEEQVLSNEEEQLHQGQLRNKKSYITPSSSLSDSGFTSSPGNIQYRGGVGILGLTLNG